MKLNENTEHPIDKLFSGRLSQLQEAPPATAWQAIEKKLEEQRTKKNKAFVWMPYAAAAAVTLIIVSVWLLKQPMPGITTIAPIAQQEPVKFKNTPDISTSVKELPARDNVVQQIQIQKQVPTQPAAEIYANNGNAQRQVIGRGKKKDNPAREHKQAEEISRPVIESVENTLANIEPEKQPATLTPSSFTENTNTTIVVTVNLDEQPAEVTEEMLETAEAEELEQPVQKQSKVGRLFNTLKKIKKADFGELGIRPETIVAYVKDKATNHSNEK